MWKEARSVETYSSPKNSRPEGNLENTRKSFEKENEEGRKATCF